ncbi:transcription attenuation protein MtrB [Paraliobacillus quinghaiensis]|uniref:Transcription attenuation protein MtrB n=1 Tax=Paraliobacillus quinghaiensis TaxID=470815 RepID=A0A917WQB5_9BACI|nr:trp RNA-binding attenuation protein MtrB [Paraliobacillus quinghaiensis]GGM22807.1 transcription attenuation protein MtrB [Paraliobacillus quinghaiensis]
MQELSQSDYFIVKALENGVQVIGLTRGTDTRFHHAEKLDENEIMVVQFTEHTSAIKIKGKAIIQSNFGETRND